MRTSTILGLLFLAVFSMPVFASAEVGANGSACDTGSGSGQWYNGQCLSSSAYPGETSGTGTSGSGVTLINPLKGVDCASGNGNCLAAFLNSILDFIIQIGTILIVLMVVYVGFKFVVAQGAPAKIEEARTMLLWTLVGALVLLGAKAISLGILATVKALGG